MLIDVAKLRMQPGTSKEYSITETLKPITWAGEILHFAGPAEVKATASNTGKNIVVKGTASVNVVSRCGRCLDTFDYKVDVDFEEEYYPKSKSTADTDEREDLHFFTGDSIDLKDAVLENIVLELPMKSVCSEKCRGLCPKCGTNLNEKECSCSHEEIDPRLEVLQKLLKQSSGKEV